MNPVILKAGYAGLDVTPSYPTPLAGYGDSAQRYHTHVLDPLYAVCVALSDGESALLLFYLDQAALSLETCSLWRKELSERHGIPVENILLNVTHTHSAPDLRGDFPESVRCREELRQAVLSLAEKALEDLTETEMFIASGQVVDGTSSAGN